MDGRLGVLLGLVFQPFLSACLTSLYGYAVYQTEGEDLSGHVKFFKKPWASTALMFVAMVMCLPIAWVASLVESRQKKSAVSSEHKPLLSDDGETSAGRGEDHNVL